MSSGLTLPPSFLKPSRWYAVYTYPRHERVVANNLKLRCIETFLPTVFASSHWKDRRVQLERPVFPGYVFTRIDMNERRAVVATPGVIRILSFNGIPTPVDDREIDSVRLCQERGASIAPHMGFEVGDRVRVRCGMLQGLEGFISRSKKEQRLIIPISAIHQSIAVEVDVHLLEPLESISIG
jgi:transcription antitermination factor NusG